MVPLDELNRWIKQIMVELRFGCVLKLADWLEEQGDPRPDTLRLLYTKQLNCQCWDSFETYTNSEDPQPAYCRSCNLPWLTPAECEERRLSEAIKFLTCYCECVLLPEVQARGFGAQARGFGAMHYYDPECGKCVNGFVGANVEPCHACRATGRMALTDGAYNYRVACLLCHGYTWVKLSPMGGVIGPLDAHFTLEMGPRDSHGTLDPVLLRS